MEEKIKDVLSQAVSKKFFPGAVVSFIKEEKTGVIPVGRVSYNDGSNAVTEDTLYDVASITKAIPTSSLALYLIEQGKLGLQDRVQQYLPHFIHSDVTIWHLLTQTLCFNHSDGPLQLSKLKHKTHDEILDAIYTADLSVPAGSTYSYCNATSIILGQVIEAATKQTLPILADEVFFQPLGMKKTTFHPDTRAGVIAPSEYDPDRGGDVTGIVHDESAYVLQKKLIVGSAGLFSTAPDLLSFLSMLLKEGEKNGVKYFSKDMLQEMTSNQLVTGSTALGWELNQPQYMGRYTNSHMTGKTGFTGCVAIFDLTKKAGMVLLSNYTYPKRQPTSEKINEVRRAVADLVFA